MRKWQLSPVFLPGKSRRQRSPVGYSPWGHKESDLTEQLSTCFTEITSHQKKIHFLPSTKSLNLAVLVFILPSSSSHGRSLPFPTESQLLTSCNEGKLEMYIFTKASGEVYPKKKGVKLPSIFIALVTPLWFSLPVLPMYE